MLPCLAVVPQCMLATNPVDLLMLLLFSASLCARPGLEQESVSQACVDKNALSAAVLVRVCTEPVVYGMCLAMRIV